MLHAERFSLAAGIVVALICAVVQSLGLTIQRKSHLQNESLPIEQRKRDWKRPTWLIGFAVFTLSNTLGSVWQLGALPIVILAPLGGVSLVWNAIFARLILGDRFTRYLIIGTILIAGGAVLVALFGTVEEPTHSLDELLHLYSRPAFIVWISLLSAGILLTLVVAHSVEMAAARKARESLEKHNPPALNRRRRWSSASQTGHSYYSMQTSESASAPSSPTMGRFVRRAAAVDGDEGWDTEEPEQLSQEESRRLLIGLAYGAASGTLSGLCLLFAKTSVELLVISVVDGKNQFNRAQPWLILIVLLVAAILQLWYLNRSLRLVGPTLICPTAFCLYNVSSILNGLFYYDQFARLAGLNIGLVALGVAILLSGVWVVSLKTSDPVILDNAAPLETTPLLANLHTSDQPARDDIESSEEEDEEVEEDEARQARRRYLLDLFFGQDDRPRGFSIGIGASSPGFAVRPRARPMGSRAMSADVGTVARVDQRRRTWTNSLAGEPYVGIESPIEAPESPSEGAKEGKWWQWKRRRRTVSESETSAG